MSMGNPTFHERTLRSTLNPATVNGASASSPWVSANNARRLCALIAVGATDTTVDAKLEQASDIRVRQWRNGEAGERLMELRSSALENFE